MLKQILTYLSGTDTHGLIISLANPPHQFSLMAYSDLDWASDSDDRRSTLRFCI